MAEGNDLAAVTVCESDVGSVTTDGVPRSAVQVAGVVVAVTGRPWAAWKARSAASVSGPKYPVTGVTCSRRCSWTA